MNDHHYYHHYEEQDQHQYLRVLHSFVSYEHPGKDHHDHAPDQHDPFVQTRSSTNDDYTGNGTPLNDVTRAITIAVHYAAIPAVTVCIWAVYMKISIFQRRVYSPFILLVALTWLLIASTFEIANHFYVNNWQLYESQADLINGSFSFFNFGAQNLLAISLRASGTSWFRHLSCLASRNVNNSDALNVRNMTPPRSPFRRTCSKIGDWLGFIIDPIMLVLIVINPIVYGVAGRSAANSILSPIAGVAAIFTMCRVWYNLGPNRYTMFGGIGFFVLAIFGVMMLALYNSSGDEWVHILIGGSFVSSVLPLAVGFYNIQDVDDDNNNDDENAVKDDENHELTAPTGAAEQDRQQEETHSGEVAKAHSDSNDLMPDHEETILAKRTGDDVEV